MSVRTADILVAAALALPWILVPLVTAWRTSRSRSLDDEDAEAPARAPVVSVVIPARDEARNIERCLRSVLAASYPRLEVIVVDDHSADGTGAIARRTSEGDPRVRVIANPDLPPGWFGKPWACHNGAAAARGEILCFIDADTAHAPDLIPRAVNAMRSRRAAMVSVAGTQELGSFWEVVIQPQLFGMLSVRYGGTESVNESPHAWDKIANGQCIFVTHESYARIGGHGAVRGEVAEDLMLAQRMFAAGERTALVLGVDQLRTRMYTSLGEVVRGWRKNVYAGGANALPKIPLAVVIFPLSLLSYPVLQLLPPVVLLLALAGIREPGERTLLWAGIATTATLATWALLYRRIGRPLWYALLYPVGAAVLLWIIVGAIARGRRVAWKGREYQAE